MIKKILISVLLLIAGLLLIVILQPLDPQQQPPSVKTHQFPDTLSGLNFSIDSLEKLVGANKGLPSGFELQGLLALSAYPELKDVSVELVMTPDVSAPMESNFDIPTLFGPKKNRVYRVLLLEGEGLQFDAILLKSLPFDAQVGILAHELGHVTYYDQLSTLQIAKWALMYTLSMDFRSKHEKSTDMMPVWHGLASQIYQYAYYVRKDASTIDLYEQYGTFIDQFYMTDTELKEYLD